MLIPSRQKNIFEYKNIHKNQTCCVFATGPSINKTDFDGLDSFFSFGCNSFYNHWFETDYFCVTDNVVWNNHRKNLQRMQIPIFKNNKSNQKNFVNISLRRDQFLVECREDYGAIDKGIYRGHTVVNHILQIAFWMGFKTVFLFGCDCKYSDSSHECHFDKTPVDSVFRTEWDEVFEQYMVSKHFYELDNRKIYNATVGGNLEVFERMSPLEWQKI
jgi:hypothetical protein